MTGRGGCEECRFYHTARTEPEIRVTPWARKHFPSGFWPESLPKWRRSASGQNRHVDTVSSPPGCFSTLVRSMLHANHILCLVTPSSPSVALSQATFLADRLEATLHVMPQPQAPSESGQARTDLHAWNADLGLDRSSTPPVHIAEGPIADSDQFGPTVSAYVAEWDVDLVVIGVSSEEERGACLRDPVLQPVLETLDRAVLIAGGNTDPASSRRLLVPTDLSAHSRAALDHGAGLASIYQSGIDVLHVVETNPYVALTPMDRLSLTPAALPEYRARRHLRAFLPSEGALEVPLESHVMFGDAAEQIVRFVEKADVDLLVLSSHGTKPVGQRTLGVVTEEVLQRVSCSVFLVQPYGPSLVAPGENAGTAPSSDQDS